MGIALFLGFGLEALADPRHARRPGEETVDERTDVESGPAHYHGSLALRIETSHHLACELLVLLLAILQHRLGVTRLGCWRLGGSCGAKYRSQAQGHPRGEGEST